MKTLAGILLILVVTFSSCKKQDLPAYMPNGTYSGTFQRIGTTPGPIANVTLNFSKGKWTGQSDKEKYPALCEGELDLQHSAITFSNACIWTAEFDWTLILNGEYTYAINGNKLQFEKQVGTTKDVYILTKQ